MNRKEVRNLLIAPDGRPFDAGETEGLIVPVLESIGKAWEEGRAALSQVYMSGRICEELFEELRPPAGTAVSGHPGLAVAVLEDYHLLGMKLVVSALRSAGFSPIVYGRREIGELVDRVKIDGARVLLVSVLMLRSALRVRELRAALGRAGLEVKLAVGGAPFRLDPELLREVGADATADSAAGAVALVRRFFQEIAP